MHEHIHLVKAAALLKAVTRQSAHHVGHGSQNKRVLIELGPTRFLQGRVIFVVVLAIEPGHERKPVLVTQPWVDRGVARRTPLPRRQRKDPADQRIKIGVRQPIKLLYEVVETF